MRRGDTAEWARRFGVVRTDGAAPNSMWDWPELAAPWSIAEAIGMIDISSTTVRPGPNSDVFAAGDLPMSNSLCQRGFRSRCSTVWWMPARLARIDDHRRRPPCWRCLPPCADPTEPTCPCSGRWPFGASPDFGRSRRRTAPGFPGRSLGGDQPDRLHPGAAHRRPAAGMGIRGDGRRRTNIRARPRCVRRSSRRSTIRTRRSRSPSMPERSPSRRRSEDSP